MHILTDILFIFMMLILFLFVYIRQKNCKKVSNDLFKFLNKNLEFLTEVQRKKMIIELKNSIKVYSKFQIIQKISKADYISFFKYNYSKKYIELIFIFSIDYKGTIIQNSEFDKYPISGRLLALDILKTDSWDDLCELEKNNDLSILEKNDNIFQIMKNKGLNKCYYQNIFKEKDAPTGFFTIGYKNEDFEIDPGDKIEILRIIESTKSII